MADIRKLDVAESATADLMELNNTIVSMRKIVKTAKVHVIRRLIQQLKRLKDKPNSEKKIKMRQREIEVIKGLSCDIVSRYALGNTAKFADVCRKPNCSLEIKALVRLVDNPVIQRKVAEFRQSHDDWQSLAMFLMAKQSGRRFHKQKNMKDKQTVIANRKTGDAMIESLIHQKLKGMDVEAVVGRKINTEHSIGGNIDSKRQKADNKKVVTDGTAIKSRETGDVDVDISAVKSKKDIPALHLDDKIPLKATNKLDVFHDGQVSDQNADEHGDDGSSSRSRVELKQKIVDTLNDVDDDKGDSSDGHSHDGNYSDVHKKVISDVTKFNSDESDVDESGGFNISCSPEAVVKQLSEREKTSGKKENQGYIHQMIRDNRASIQKGEMIVRQIDLSQLENDDEVDIVFNKVDNSDGKDEFAIRGTEKKKRDKFFVCGDIDDDDEDDDDGDHEEEAINIEDIRRFQDSDDYRSSALHNIKSSFVSLRHGDSEDGDVSFDRGRKPFGGNKYKQHTHDLSNNKGGSIQKKTAYVRSATTDRKGGRWSESDGATIWSRSRLQQGSTNEPSMLKVKPQKIQAGKGANHPSWEASRKRKEETSNIDVFRGKKTKFDDD